MSLGSCVCNRKESGKYNEPGGLSYIELFKSFNVALPEDERLKKSVS